MKILFAGTAASEGWPAVFCECRHCREARLRGARNIRLRSSIILGERYRIDFPPDSFAQALRDGLCLASLEHVIITHPHEDHFYAEDLVRRAWPFAHPPDHSMTSVPPVALRWRSPLHVWGSKTVGEELERKRQSVGCEEPGAIEFHLVEPMRLFQAGELDVLPLPADHLPRDESFVYLIRRGQKRLLYGIDSGWFPEPTWQALQGQRLDVAILDGTFGPVPWRSGHLGLPDCLAVRDELLRLRAADEQTLFVVTHFSHNGGLLHEELVAQLSGTGLVPAYDGMVIDF